MVETLTSPAQLDPPFVEPVLDAGGLVTPVWAAWLTALAGRVGVGNTGVTRAGPLVSDATGHVAVAFDPPFLTNVVYVAAHDFTGIAGGLSGIVADATGFTAVLADTGSSALPDYTCGWWAVGY